MKTVAVLGSGIVGQTLAAGFLKHGYSVVIGTQNPGKKLDWLSPQRHRKGSHSTSGREPFPIPGFAARSSNAGG